MIETTKEHRHLLREHVRSTGTLSHSVDVEGELLPLLNDADRLAAIERDVRELAERWDERARTAGHNEGGGKVQECAKEMRAILDPPEGE